MSDDEIKKLIIETSKEELIILIEVAKSWFMHDLKEKIINHLEILEN